MGRNQLPDQPPVGSFISISGGASSSRDLVENSLRKMAYVPIDVLGKGRGIRARGARSPTLGGLPSIYGTFSPYLHVKVEVLWTLKPAASCPRTRIQAAPGASPSRPLWGSEPWRAPLHGEGPGTLQKPTHPSRPLSEVRQMRRRAASWLWLPPRRKARVPYLFAPPHQRA